MSGRRGATLLELLAVIAIMAVLYGVVALAQRKSAAPAQSTAALVASARHRAIVERTPTTVELSVNGAPHAATALPDGSVLADTAVHVDRLGGRMQ